MAKTLYTRNIIIVIQASLQAAANTRALEVDPVGGGNTFTVGLSSTGNLPATHYWAAGVVTVDEDTKWRGSMGKVGTGNKVRIYDGNTTTPAQVLATTGLKEIIQ